MNYQPNTIYYDLGYRFVILGDRNTGKSSLITKMCDGRLSTCATIGAEFRAINVKINEKNCKLHVWDTSGKTEQEELITPFIKDRDGIILCFNLADPETFLNLDKWKILIDKYKSIYAQVLLVGVKSDLEREVAYEQGEKYAIDNKWIYTEISCVLDTKNIISNKVFIFLADKIHLMYPNLESDLITRPPPKDIIATTAEPKSKPSAINHHTNYSVPSMCSIL
jgi:small GTP-binding protein